MCKFFAYDFDCPDLIEFGDCAFQHDERLLKAHRIKERQEDTLDIEELATLTEKLILEDAEDDETILYRRTILRIWPDPPTDKEKKKAKEEIENFFEKIKFK